MDNKLTRLSSAKDLPTPGYESEDRNSAVYKLQRADDTGRYPYDGKGPYTAPNGDQYPAKKYDNVIVSVALYILVMECAERLCYYGIIGSLKAYLTNYLFYSNAQANALTNTITTVVYFTPLLGAYMADTVWGRFKTILYFGCIYVVGVIVISISAYPSLANSPSFLIGLYVLVATGAGGIKPNVVTFGADQFDISTAEGVKQQQQFFNFFYWVINVGAVFSYSVLAQMAVQGMGAISPEYGFFASFTISAGAWIIAITVFLIGSKRYIKRAPVGSELIDFLKLFYSIAGKSWKGLAVFLSIVAFVLGVVLSCISSFLPAGGAQDVMTYITAVLFIGGWIFVVVLNRDPQYVYEAVGKGNFSQKNISEAYTFLRVWSPVFFAVLFWLIYNQMSSSMYSVACQMDLIVYGDTPLNGSLLNLGDTFAIVIFIPILERVGYPLIERIKGSKFTSLQKMFWGMIFATLAMVSTAIIESIRKNRPVLVDLGDSVCAPPGVKMSDMSVWWMLIPYMLIGIAECLISVPLYDLNYVEVPEGVRSSAQALNLFTTSISGGVGSIITLLFASWITDDLNNGKMDLLFWFLSALMAAGAIFFVYVVKDFKYIHELHQLDKTEFAGEFDEGERQSMTRASFASLHK